MKVLDKKEKIAYEDVMKMVDIIHLKIVPQKPPKGFEGW